MRLTQSFMRLALLSTLLLAPITQADPKIEKVVNAYLAGVAKVLGGTEQKGVRRAALGDLDNDGDKDLVIAFLLEGVGGSTNWGQYIAVFRLEKGSYKGITDQITGGKFSRYFTLEGILNQRIIGVTETCPTGEPQGTCTSPALGTISFTLSDNKIIERK